MLVYLSHNSDISLYSASHPLLVMETDVPWILMVMVILISHLIRQYAEVLKGC